MNVVLMGIVGSSIDDTISFDNEKGMTLKQIMIVKAKALSMIRNSIVILDTYSVLLMFTHRSPLSCSLLCGPGPFHHIRTQTLFFLPSAVPTGGIGAIVPHFCQHGARYCAKADEKIGGGGGSSKASEKYRARP